MGITKELMRHSQISTTINVYGTGTITPAKREAQETIGRLLIAPEQGKLSF